MNVKNYIHIAMLVIVVATLCLCVHHYRERTNKAGTDFRSIEQRQSAVTSELESVSVGLAGSQKSVDRIESRIDSATVTVDNGAKLNSDSTKRVESSASLIAEGKAICKKVRERK